MSVRHRDVFMWMQGGDCGLSSKAIAGHMAYGDSTGDHPLDPADLGRCLRLLELFPEWKPRIKEMAVYSPQWQALAERWDDLRDSMEKEVGIRWEKGRSAPKTYKMMCDLRFPTNGSPGD